MTDRADGDEPTGLPRIGPGPGHEDDVEPEPTWAAPVEDTTPKDPIAAGGGEADRSDRGSGSGVGEVFALDDDTGPGIGLPTGTGTGTDGGRSSAGRGPEDRRHRVLRALGTVAVVALVAAVLAYALVRDGNREEVAAPLAQPDGTLEAELAGPTERPRALWSIDEGCGSFGGEIALRVEDGDLIRASPSCAFAADDTRVYALVPDGLGRVVGGATPEEDVGGDLGDGATLTAYDGVTGEVAWKAAIPTVAGTVAVVDDLVLVSGGDPATYRTTAHDAETGARRWAADGYATGAGGNGLLLVQSADGARGRMAAVSLDDGEVRWEHEAVGEAQVCGDLVLTRAPGAGGRATQEPPAVTRDLDSGEERWRRPQPEGSYVTCAEEGVVAVDGEDVRGLDPDDGTERWQTWVPEASGLRMAADLVLVEGTRGLVALQLADGEERWVTDSADGGDPYVLHPFGGPTTLAVNTVWIRALDVADGSVVEQVPVGDGFRVGLPQGIVFTFDRGEVASYDLADLTERWRLPVLPQASELLIGGGRLYVRSPGGLTAYA